MYFYLELNIVEILRKYYEKITDSSSDMAMVRMENAFKNACNLQQPLD